MWIKEDGIKINLQGVWNDITRPFRTFIKGIKNIVTWFPTIWNDRDFDDSYMFMIWIKKMKTMEKFFRSDDVWSEDALIYADQIKKTRELLEYIDNEKYEEEAFEKYYKKYPFDEERFEKMMKNEPYEKDSEEKTQMFKDCMAKSEKLYIKAMNNFCTELKINSRGWWD